MSGEFGSYLSGYFDSQMDTAASDCLGGDLKLTKLWGEFLSAFVPVARGIAYAEAGDTGEAAAVIDCIEAMTELKHRLALIEVYLTPFQEVAREAVNKYVDKMKAGQIDAKQAAPGGGGR